MAGRITQVAEEVFETAPGDGRVTQVAEEVFETAPGDGRATQIAVEIWYTGDLTIGACRYYGM
jgi:hypothetical protein